MINSLPTELVATVEYRFPDYLDADYVRHSDRAFTLVVMDLDYKHYTFRMILGDSGRWTLVPISGFCYDEERLHG